MATSCNHIYVHFVWATWNKAPMLSGSLEAPIYACIAKKCQELRCDLVEINGTADHVHALVRLHSTVSTALIAKEMKGASSHLATHIIAPGRDFKWQGSYGAFSVTPTDVDRVRTYIRRQKEHHANASTWPEWERCDETEQERSCLKGLP
jgi:REP element-mobilizing transposase RayT